MSDVLAATGEGGAEADQRVPFAMPSLGADMEHGTIVEWLVQPGAAVARGDVVAVVETEKSNLDIEVFADGVVRELLVPVGVKVPVGTPIAMIEPRRGTRRAGERSSPATHAPAPEPVVESPPATTAASVAAARTPEIHSPLLRHLAERLRVDLGTVSGTGTGGVITRDDIERAATPRRRVTPRARRLAAERHLDLVTVARGATGVITGDDVERAAGQSPTSAGAVAATVPAPGVGGLSSMRAAIARQMERAWREIPHFQVADSIDVTRAVAALTERNAARGASARVLLAAMLARAAARAAAEVGVVNGFWRDGQRVDAAEVHLGVVVALRSGGLVAPVIHHASTLDLDAFMAGLRDLVTRARAGRLKASEMTGATFTITQLGDDEADTVVPIIHPPQLGILGLGAVRRRPWVDGEAVVVREVVRACLSLDHRAVDGRGGSAFLLAFARFLREEPV